MNKIEENLQNLQSKIKSTTQNKVQIIAVSKYTTIENIKNAHSLGIRDFGENYISSLQERKELIKEPINWHFIGHLQSNKILKLLKINPKLFQSLDSLKLAYKLDEAIKNQKIEGSLPLDYRMDALLQVKISNEISKIGIPQESAGEIYARIVEECANLNLKGLMGIAAAIRSKADIASVDGAFANLYKIYSDLRAPKGILSMGMSEDFAIALANGSNMIRLGSSLFN